LVVQGSQVVVGGGLVSENSRVDEGGGGKWVAGGVNQINGDNQLFLGGNTESIEASRNSVADAMINIAQGNAITEAILAPDALNVDLGVANPTGSVAVGFVSSDGRLQMELKAIDVSGSRRNCIAA